MGGLHLSLVEALLPCQGDTNTSCWSCSLRQPSVAQRGAAARLNRQGGTRPQVIEKWFEPTCCLRPDKWAHLVPTSRNHEVIEMPYCRDGIWITPCPEQPLFNQR